MAPPHMWGRLLACMATVASESPPRAWGRQLFQNCRKPPETSPVPRPAQSPPVDFPPPLPPDASPCPPSFFCCRPAGSPLLFSRCGRLPAGSHLPPLAPDAAMARARRRSRTPAGRTERQSRREHHPGHRPGKVRADAPRDTRRAGYSQPKRHLPRSRKRGVRGCRGCRGGNPLTPCPTPGRRPAARSGQPPQDKEEKRKGFSV